MLRPMKITVDVDCTPEEARRFLGLPDLAPVHDAWVAGLQARMAEAATPEAAAELMRTWSSGGFEAWRAMVGAMARPTD